MAKRMFNRRRKRKLKIVKERKNRRSNSIMDGSFRIQVGLMVGQMEKGI